MQHAHAGLVYSISFIHSGSISSLVRLEHSVLNQGSAFRVAIANGLESLLWKWKFPGSIPGPVLCVGVP